MPIHRSFRPLRTIAPLPVLCFAASAQAGDPIVIGTLPQDRSSRCSAISYAFRDGNFFTTVRTALESNANFGKGGIVGRDIAFAHR